MSAVGKPIIGYTKYGRPIFGTKEGAQYRTQLATSYSRAATRKESILEKYVNLLTGQIIPDVETAREEQGAIFDQITAYQNTPGKSPADEDYKKLKILYEIATNKYIRAMKTAVKEMVAASTTAAAVATVDAEEAAEDAALEADDVELMGLFKNLKMGGGYRKSHRKSRKSRKSRKARKARKSRKNLRRK
jgi:hypothetical protein